MINGTDLRHAGELRKGSKKKHGRPLELLYRIVNFRGKLKEKKGSA